MNSVRVIRSALPAFAEASTFHSKTSLCARLIHTTPKRGNFFGQPPKPQQDEQAQYVNLVNSRFFALHRPLLSVNGSNSFLNPEAILPATPPMPADEFDNNLDSELPEESVTNFSTIPEYVRLGPFAGTVLPPPSLFLNDSPQEAGLDQFFENIQRKYAEPSSSSNPPEQSQSSSEAKLELNESDCKLVKNSEN
ncbi:hypothetical protein K493DRAFT_360571 [Basidiobolus meristosporus CBS 931.73]|uniref:Uncharacterized protein n=1 Tax=Basidiobolus meristosporus CBS 931.73 TaxID=1314790 RepID=A0A1Y1XHJ5_9FUNG|nr:hypothetical protein K493DRAFT_360571 [Basidiobolus meristosporus CBS 931.73]|eukprot:ORX84854.1 hypothetical protein K493DRAFT_360571 [Basidiobolus meristosporus CBS 931.73]